MCVIGESIVSDRLTPALCLEFGSEKYFSASNSLNSQIISLFKANRIMFTLTD